MASSSSANSMTLFSTDGTPLCELITLNGNFDEALKQLEPYIGFVVDCPGKEAQLAAVKEYLTGAGGRVENTFLWTIQQSPTVPEILLKIVLELGPAVPEGQARGIVEKYKGLKLKEHGDRVQMMLDCVRFPSPSFGRAVCSIKVRCLHESACTKLAAAGTKLYTIGKIYPNNYEPYRLKIKDEEDRFDLDTCASLLIMFEPKTLEQLAAQERWYAILNRVRNGCVDPKTSRKELEFVYKVAGQAGRYGIQAEFAYRFPEIFPRQPAKSYAVPQPSGDVRDSGAEFVKEMVSDVQSRLDERFEKQKSIMTGYIDGRIEGQVSVLSQRLSAAEREIERLKRNAD